MSPERLPYWTTIPWLKKIIWVIRVLRRTVVCDWRLDNLCGSHLPLWRWLPHRLSKRQSQTTVLLRTLITQMIFFNQVMLLLGWNHFLMNQYCLLVHKGPYLSVLANIFMCHFEEKWFMNGKDRPSVWFRYVDDTFTLYRNKDTAINVPHYLNCRHNNIQFTVEFENNYEIPVLDVSVKRHENKSFSTSIYCKETPTGPVFTLNGTHSHLD